MISEVKSMVMTLKGPLCHIVKIYYLIIIIISIIIICGLQFPSENNI